MASPVEMTGSYCATFAQYRTRNEPRKSSSSLMRSQNGSGLRSVISSLLDRPGLDDLIDRLGVVPVAVRLASNDEHVQVLLGGVEEAGLVDADHGSAGGDAVDAAEGHVVLQVHPVEATRKE